MTCLRVLPPWHSSAFEGRILPVHRFIVPICAFGFLAVSNGAIARDAARLRLHQCVATRIATLGSRLEGAPSSGSFVAYANGIVGVSYDTVHAIRASRVGDPIELCLKSLPEDCPKGDDRGKVYTARDLRTGGSWELPDSEHMCGGA